MLAVKVFLGFILLPAGCDNGGPVLFYDSLFPAARGQCSGEIPDNSRGFPDLCLQENLEKGMVLDPLNEVFQIGGNLLTLPSGAEPFCRTSKLTRLFHQVCLTPLLCDTKGCLHTGDASTDNQGSIVYIKRNLLKRFHQGGLCHGHSNEVFGFFGRLFWVIHMDPGVLIADVGHFKEVLVETRIPNGLLK